MFGSGVCQRTDDYVTICRSFIIDVEMWFPHSYECGYMKTQGWYARLQWVFCEWFLCCGMCHYVGDLFFGIVLEVRHRYSSPCKQTSLTRWDAIQIQCTKHRTTHSTNLTYESNSRKKYKKTSCNEPRKAFLTQHQKEACHDTFLPVSQTL